MDKPVVYVESLSAEPTYYIYALPTKPAAKLTVWEDVEEKKEQEQEEIVVVVEEKIIEQVEVVEKAAVEKKVAGPNGGKVFVAEQGLWTSPLLARALEVSNAAGRQDWICDVLDMIVWDLEQERAEARERLRPAMERMVEEEVVYEKPKKSSRVPELDTIAEDEEEEEIVEVVVQEEEEEVVENEWVVVEDDIKEAFVMVDAVVVPSPCRLAPVKKANARRSKFVQSKAGTACRRLFGIGWASASVAILNPQDPFA